MLSLILNGLLPMSVIILEFTLNLHCTSKLHLLFKIKNVFHFFPPSFIQSFIEWSSFSETSLTSDALSHQAFQV